MVKQLRDIQALEELYFFVIPSESERGRSFYNIVIHRSNSPVVNSAQVVFRVTSGRRFGRLAAGS